MNEPVYPVLARAIILALVAIMRSFGAAAAFLPLLRILADPFKRGVVRVEPGARRVRARFDSCTVRAPDPRAQVIR
ncbi:MAG TPA: hypothetical protein VMJ11_06710 [Paraburkholderia sp.]|uniref:hypothetical protein n=1 Tax=Paraburkholderia sp. TaxID=1926495 RepID=UPI002CC51EDF|nr:hypothetical protein [Paraburkholderia sp.]HTR06339.1 hypothetical protein [Paraburkholderia sp.]